MKNTHSPLMWAAALALVLSLPCRGHVASVMQVDSVQVSGLLGSTAVRVRAVAKYGRQDGVTGVNPEITWAFSQLTRLDVWIDSRPQRLPARTLKGLYNVELSSTSVVRLDNGNVAVVLHGGDGESTYKVMVEFDRGRAVARRVIIGEHEMREAQ